MACRLLTLLAFLHFASFASAEVVAKHGASYLERGQGQTVLHLKGSYREMGRAHGILLKEAVAENVEAFLDHWCVEGGREKLDRLREIYVTFAPFLPERYQQELEGLAEGSGVPLERLQLLHAIPERFHCTGIAAFGPMTRDGKLYHTRSLDYAIDIGKNRRPQDNADVIVYEPDDGHSHVVIGWAGCIGCVSGMNNQGISIGEMGSASRDESYSGIPMLFLMREALRQGGSLDQAVAVFAKGPRTCGYNFIVADGKIPDARAVEVTRSHCLVFKPNDAQESVAPHVGLAHCLRRCNHFVGEATAATQRDKYDPRENNTASWVAYDLLTYYLKNKAGQLDAPMMMNLLRLYPPSVPVLHQVVFAPTDLDFWVANARNPKDTPLAGAQHQPFHRFNLQRLLKGEPLEDYLAVLHKEKPRTSPPEPRIQEVSFKPSADQESIPECYRLAAHDFKAEATMLQDFNDSMGFALWQLKFPSPVATAYEENNTVHAEYYRPKGTGPFPAVIVLDILGGDQTLSRLQSTVLAQHGVAALFVQMPYYGQRRPNGKHVRLLTLDVEHSVAAVRQTVLDLRRATAWLEAQSEVNPKRLGIMGTSLGSFMAALTCEMEPKLHRAAILLGGGGLVDAYANHPDLWPLRIAAGLLKNQKEKLAERIAPADPITLAARLRERDVLMIGARRDEVVPPKAMENLWIAAGKPRILWYDCTHAGAAIYAVPALQEVITHFNKP